MRSAVVHHPSFSIGRVEARGAGGRQAHASPAQAAATSAPRALTPLGPWPPACERRRPTPPRSRRRAARRPAPAARVRGRGYPILAYISPISRIYRAYISPISRLHLAYISPLSRLTCASAREMIAAVTPEPHDVTSCSAVPTPAVSKAAWRRSGGSILPSSPSRLPKGKLRDPGMWPERQSARGLRTRRAQGHLSSRARRVSGAPVRAAAQGGGGGAHSAAVPSKRAAGRASTTRERRPGAACRFSWI